MTNYIILLPPSEGKNGGGEKQEMLSFPELNNTREQIRQSLLRATNELSQEDFEKLFELKGKNLDYAINITKKPTKALPAIKRYEGVMFKAISYEILNKEQKKHFDNSVLFIDGRYGLLRPQDTIPDYKLKITSKIQELNITKLWKKELAQTIQEQTKNKLLIDLLPQAHKKTLPEIDLVTITFAKKQNDKMKNEGHNAKKLKGQLIQYITREESITRQYLEQYVSEEGHKYNEELSNEQEIIYLKQ